MTDVRRLTRQMVEAFHSELLARFGGAGDLDEPELADWLSEHSRAKEPGTAL